jgi:RNA polymerase sporulation-specific sigma factor
LVNNNDKRLNQEISKYEYIIRIILTKYSISYNDYDDAFQEGRLALLKAIESFKAEVGVNFTSFASICIKRRILSYLRNQNRKKNRPFRNNYRVDYEDFENRINLTNFRQYNSADSILIKLHRESIYKNVVSKMKLLEKEIISNFLIGYSVNELSIEYQIPKRKVYKIISNARKEIEKRLND